MRTIQVSEFKARFPEIIDSVRGGESIVITDSSNREKVAVLIPYDQLSAHQPSQLGTLAGVASVSFAEKFAITDEELLGA
jgi:prevent-host-death family protein